MNKHFHRIFSAGLLSAGIVLSLFASAAAEASIAFKLDSYAIDALDSDPGLVVNTADVLGQPYSFDLALGQSHTVDLFEIWTDEGAHNSDDSVQEPISVGFSFSLPAPAFGGSVGGDTSAVTGLLIILPYSAGLVDWAGSTILDFGPNGDGQLQITLSDEYFNGSLIGSFLPGREYAATVQAEFKLLAEPTAVPEATSLLAWTPLVLVIGALVYRRNYGPWALRA